MVITVLDTETTGLDLSIHEILQFAAVRFFLKEDGDILILDKVDIKISPKNLAAASPQALKVNGFTEAAWSGALPIEHHLGSISDFVSNSDFLLGQNLIFDLRFIEKAFVDNSRPLPKFPHYADTKHMASKLVKEGKLKTASMDGLVQHYGIKFSGRAHTALADCHRTLNVWQRLLKETDMDFFTYKEPYDPFKNR
jgi:DNA polymerase III epsilon subunit-like protein